MPTTKEFIEKLQEVDPEGTSPLDVFIEGWHEDDPHVIRTLADRTGQTWVRICASGPPSVAMKHLGVGEAR